MAGYLRFVPMLLCMGTLFFLSHQPGDSFDLPLFPGADKLTHMIAYGVLGATVIFGFSAEARKTKRVLVLVAAVLVPVLFGLSDEYHQSYIAGRSSEVLDLVADGAGGLIVGVCWFFKRGHK
jgi:VanZ family protein